MSEAAVQEQNMLEEAASPELTAGQMLREAREHAGVRLPSLAANLKVAVSKLEALEANEWGAFPDVVFIRALASAVCRVLRIDAAPVLDKLPKAPGQTLAKVGEGINAKVSEGNASARSGDFAGSKPFPWMGVVGLIVVATVGVLFYPQLMQYWKAQAGSNAPVTALRSSSVAATGESTEPAVALGGVTDAPPATDAVSSAAAPVPPVVTAEVPSVNVPLMRVKAQQDSWVQVKDANGAVVFEKTIKAGEEHDIAGTAPWKVVIGNAVAVKLLVRGESFDLQKVMKGSTARFEVN